MIYMHKNKVSRLFIFILLAGICSFASIQVRNKRDQKPPVTTPDSLLLKLQQYIDTNYAHIASYCKAESEMSLCSYQLTVNDSLSKARADSFRTMLNADISRLCAQSTAARQPEKIQAVKTLYEKVNHFETAEKQLETDNNNQHKLITSLDSQLTRYRKKYDPVSQTLIRQTSLLKGAGMLTINNHPYRFFIASAADHTIHIHNTKGPASIETLKKETAKTNTPLMITNGGMFMPGYSAQGLLIEAGQVKHELDTLQPRNNNNGNFYLLPNGVFFIDAAGKYHIEETKAFRKTGKGNPKIQFATQSGPLLTYDKVINKNFKAGSENLNIRSGVGIIDNDRAIFIISDAKVNFFEFALVFREIFHCSNSLYLDGAISQMYINDSLLKKPGMAIDGSFGPLISITPKKKL
jgi:uncharacterized protein YigE (DUF2233 family)